MTKELGQELCEVMIVAMARHMNYEAEPWPALDKKLKAVLADAEVAVRAAALEEAARVADARNYLRDAWVEGDRMAVQIAAAIRAMKEPTA